MVKQALHQSLQQKLLPQQIQLMKLIDKQHVLTSGIHLRVKGLYVMTLLRVVSIDKPVQKETKLHRLMFVVETGV